MTRVNFHDAALREIEHEVEYYTAISPLLGRRFADAVEKAVTLASDFPEMGSPHRLGTRRVFPKRFPFSVVYVYRRGEVFVVALAPDDKKPGYWRERLAEV